MTLPPPCNRSLKLTLLGRSADRWKVRVELGEGFHPTGLTVALVTESGRCLGPLVVIPPTSGRCFVAEVRGPETMPPGTVIEATVDTEEGETLHTTLGVDPRNGLHAFLHADGRLPLESNPVGTALSRKELQRLATHFPWVRGCCTKAEEADAAPPEEEGSDPLVDMLKNEFDIDPDDLDDELLEALRR